MTISCKVLKRSGNSAVLAYRDAAGMWQGAIVSVNAIDSDNVVKVGAQVDVSEQVLDNALEYGIDFSILMPEHITISANDVQQALRSYGVWDDEDILKRPRDVVAALQSVVRLTYADIVNRVLITLGG